MTLTDAYCIYNRARGTALVSPEDLLKVPRARARVMGYALYAASMGQAARLLGRNPEHGCMLTRFEESGFEVRRVCACRGARRETDVICARRADQVIVASDHSPAAASKRIAAMVAPDSDLPFLTVTLLAEKDSISMVRVGNL